MAEDLIQFGIVIFGTSALVLVSIKNKYGFILGLISQQFFLITSFHKRQWGIFVLSVIQTGVWVYGIYNWFFKSNSKK